MEEPRRPQAPARGDGRAREPRLHPPGGEPSKGCSARDRPKETRAEPPTGAWPHTGWFISKKINKHKDPAGDTRDPTGMSAARWATLSSSLSLQTALVFILQSQASRIAL